MGSVPFFSKLYLMATFFSLFYCTSPNFFTVEARAEIVGPTLKYLTPGSTLKLICKVLQSTEATAYIFWYHDNRMINYDLDRGINVSSEAGKLKHFRINDFLIELGKQLVLNFNLLVLTDFHYSELTILHTTKNHSGNYTCVPSNAAPASVVVHIFKGKLCLQTRTKLIQFTRE